MMNRFEQKIDKSGDCWLWTASRNNGGYGLFKLAGKTTTAHRISYELHVGVIPDGMCVLHTCDVRMCVNPDHLFLGTQTDNMQDKANKGRHHGQLKTHCKHGHEYTKENTYMRGDGRHCRECKSKENANYRKRVQQ